MAAAPGTQEGRPSGGRLITIPTWRRWLIRVRAYFLKEVNELRRQPMLILSLIVGPLLVLIVFGSTYANSTPRIRTAVVLPAGGLNGISEQQIRELLGTNFDIQSITSDRAAADAALAAGDVDLIQVLPDTLNLALASDAAPQIQFISNAINPLNEGWIQYLAYAEINEVNKAILRATTRQAQQEAATIQVRLLDADGVVAELQQGLETAQSEEARRSLDDSVELLGELEQVLPPQEVLAAQGGELATMRQQIGELRSRLLQLGQAIDDGTLAERAAELADTRQQIQVLNHSVELFISATPDKIVAPVSQSYQNVRGGSYSAVIYYAPGVLALLVQHTAITLGALALVRERLMGAFEVFRVAPVNLTQLILGKYMGYTLFIGLATLVLNLAMALLGVPLLGSWLQFAGLTLMLIVASLGVGFLISALSGSDSQAIQLAMISLLLSIFFSGFFIALESFAWPALPVAYSIPMTHGLAGYQNLMLRGIAPDLWVWVGLAAIAVISFVLVVVLTRRQLRKA